MTAPLLSVVPRFGQQTELIMGEFFRDGAIVLMGLTVIAAGVVVVIYG